MILSLGFKCSTRKEEKEVRQGGRKEDWLTGT
jgi:hypothetical protein